ncbi:hypothetical protein HEP_00370800, partial [Hepatocystis sp. ex Piliocolobus tephrosceles]
MVEEQKIINLLLNFAKKGLKKKEWDEDMVKIFFSDVVLTLIDNIDKYKLCTCISDYIANEIKEEGEKKGEDEGKKKKKYTNISSTNISSTNISSTNISSTDISSTDISNINNHNEKHKKINILVLFLICLYKQFGEATFLNINYSWINKLIKIKNGYNKKNVLQFVAIILLLPEQDKESSTISQIYKNKFHLVHFLITYLINIVYDKIKENNEFYLYYKKAKDIFYFLKNSDSNNADFTIFCDKAREQKMHKKKENFNNTMVDKKEVLEEGVICSSVNLYKNILNNFTNFNFINICDLFIIILEELEKKKEMSTYSDSYKNNTIKKDIEKIMYASIFIQDKNIHSYIIKNFFLITKTYIFTKKEFEICCKNIIQIMFFFMTKGNYFKNMDICPKQSNHINSFNVKKDNSVIVDSNILNKLSTTSNNKNIYNDLFYITFCKKEEKTDINICILNDIYNFLILYIDYIYNENFVKTAFINDVRYGFLLFSQSYKNENILKKINFIFNHILDICKEKQTKQYRKSILLFSHAWELYACVLDCIKDFSLHLLKTNWSKMVEFLNITSNIRKKYKSFFFLDTEKKKKKSDIKPCQSIEELGQSNEERCQSIKYDFLDDPIDFYIFECCIKKTYDQSACNFGSYVDFIILKLNEQLIHLLLTHKNNSVISFSLCAMIDYNTEWYNKEG